MKGNGQMTKNRGITPQTAQQIRKEKGLSDTNLLKMRLKRGLSQDSLAKAAGIRSTTIRSYEQKARNIDRAPLDTLCSLSLALDCSIEDILESTDLIKKFKLAKRGKKL